MTTVTISPPVVNVCDILQYAHALIEEHGWRQGSRVPDSEEWDEVAKNGLSLHDSIGMACYRLSGEVGMARQPKGTVGSYSKDFPTQAIHGYSGQLRDDTNMVISKHLPDGMTDIVFNDQAKDVGEVLAVLDAAIQEVCVGK